MRLTQRERDLAFDSLHRRVNPLMQIESASRLLGRLHSCLHAFMMHPDKPFSYQSAMARHSIRELVEHWQVGSRSLDLARAEFGFTVSDGYNLQISYNEEFHRFLRGKSRINMLSLHYYKHELVDRLLEHEYQTYCK